MSCRQVNSANRLKAALISDMGGCCWACGSSGPLDIDHPHGRDWQPRTKSFSHRIAIYRREWEARLIRLLCESCNSSKRFNNVILHRPGATLEAVPEDPGQPF